MLEKALVYYLEGIKEEIEFIRNKYSSLDKYNSKFNYA